MSAQEYVEFEPRLDGDNIEIRGDILLVGNNIMNRASQSNPQQANTPYNGNQNNNSLWMEYIDIDSDPATFSSSSAELNIPDPDCSQVRYAGLYWAGTYPNERSTNGGQQFSGTPRIEEWNEIKFKIPGGNYVDLVADNDPDPAGEEDDIIVNGYQPANPGTFIKDGPVVCYKNVTDLVRSNANPNGEYTAANIRATRGRRSGSSSAGWVLVVIYENPTEPGKFISTFDGYASVSRSASNIDVLVEGFRTLPAPFNVNANIGVAALEGDLGIRGDRFLIDTPIAAGGFNRLEENNNPRNNFFNSTITYKGNQVPTRTPYGTNTLGLDLDLIELDNNLNSILPNDETEATLRFTSSGDGYGPFLAVFAVEIIEPNIVLEKKVREFGNPDPNTNDITGAGVNLGDDLIYELTFNNIGNDDATGLIPGSSDPYEANYIIRDLLPINTTLVNVDLSQAPNVVYKEEAPGELFFAIPDNLVLEGGPRYTIRIQVRVAENCFDFVDACSNRIDNLAYSTYRGVDNSATISDDPSVSDFDNCGFVTPGATNFLLDDLDDCNFTRTEQLCGNSIQLEAGENFNNYVWVLDANNNGEIDPGDPVLSDGPQNSIVVSDVGTYIVDKQIDDPCKGFKEIINVERFGTTQTDPIIALFNDANNDGDPDNDIRGEIATCSDNGRDITNLFLCGSNDSQNISLNISDARGISWQRFNASGSCVNTDPSCPTVTNSCYSEVTTGNVFTANTAGQYRVVLTYQDGCTSIFYFNVFQNNLDIEFRSRNIICETPGNITVTRPTSGYGFQLFNLSTNSVQVPYGVSNSFDITTSGAYKVEVIQLGPDGLPLTGACVFETDPIEVLQRPFEVTTNLTPENCNTPGSINIQALNVVGDYHYEIRIADGSPPPPITSPDYYAGHPGGTFLDDERAQPSNNFTFNNLTQGDYHIITRTADGCFNVTDVTLSRDPNPVVSAITTANIGCTAGTIELTPNGGPAGTEYSYAIWSKNGSQLYTDISDIPGSEFRLSNTFTFGWEDEDADDIYTYIPNDDGTYIFIVVDDNNCIGYSNPVRIDDNGSMTATVPTPVDVSCSGRTDGEINIVATGGVSPYQYSIDDGTTFQNTAGFVNLGAGTYNVVVTDDSGCEVRFVHDVNEPFPLSAATGVSRDVSCNPTLGAQVRVTNVTGGTAPYSYSFDGGANFGTNSVADLQAGSYTIIVRDANDCEFPMNITVDDLPQRPIVTLTPTVDYGCDGLGTIEMSPDITTYDYTYELNGVLNTPPDSNTFTGLTPATYTVTTNYIPQTPPTPSVLLLEDFGSGPTVPSPNTTIYYYEDQTGGTHANMRPGDGTNTQINDNEYAVTSNIVSPFGAWIRPVTDHTSNGSDPDGRYLVVNIGEPDTGQAIYRSIINDIYPNQDITVSLWALNLMQMGNPNGVDPDLTIELREVSATGGTGNLVASATTGIIPRNNTWNQPPLISLNPGTNSSLELLIITNESEDNGNDVAIDDILVEQTPEVCEQSIDTEVLIEGGRTFEGAITGTKDVTCNGQSNGSITFSVANFDPTAGFDYSVDNRGTWTNSTTSPQPTPELYAAGSHTVWIRKADDTSCMFSLTTTISQPDLITVNASVTSALTCNADDAVITANATGGIPGFTYQLQDANTGTPITGYDFATNTTNTVFSGLGAGSYIVAVLDTNNCPAQTGTPIQIVTPSAPVIDTVDATDCYSGNSDGTITVTVSGGTGTYLFQLNGTGPWLSPDTATPNTYVFEDLSNGSYTIDVSDSLGCDAVQETAQISPSLNISATAANIRACDTATDINITANGGSGTLVFAIAPRGTVPPDGNFSTTNPISVSVPDDYDVFVRDNSGNPGYCQELFPITIAQDPPLDVSVAHDDVSCNGGANGSISVTVNGGGEAPYRYSIDNGASYQLSPNFPNLSQGDYEIQVIDNRGCNLPAFIARTIAQPDALSADNPVLTQDYLCGPVLGQITVSNPMGGSGSYQYNINNGAWTTSTTGGHIFTDLADGTYTILVRDANDPVCTLVLPDVVIDPLPTPPTLGDSITYNCDGSGNITITPFDANYTYILDGALPGQTGTGANVFSNVSPGPHTVTVDYGRDCSLDHNLTVLDGQAFAATIIRATDPSCNSDTDGTIRIEIENFGSSYSYTTDGGTTTQTGTTSPLDLTGLGDGTLNIDITVGSCTLPLSRTLTAPSAVRTTASVTEVLTCNNTATGATITADAMGGTPGYEYQLENTSGTAISGYDYATNGSNTIFSGLSAGDYIVRARDVNGCDDEIDTALSIVTPTIPAFTAVPTPCYSGANDGTIAVNVTGGNGAYLFRIDGGPWEAPTPANSSNYTFSNLANGSYTIDVRDAYGCSPAQQTIVLNPQLRATATLRSDLTCTADATIDIDAIGGSGTYSYQWGNTATGPWNTSGFTGNVFTTNTDGTYYFLVSDTTTPTVCTVTTNEVVVSPALTPVITSITPTNLRCNNDASGALDIVIDTNIGLAPFTISVVNTSTATNYGTQTTGLAAGNYEVTVTDAKGCFVVGTETITEPAIIDYTATSTPITCDVSGTTTNPGSISISGITGGTAEYTYYLSANNGIPTQTHATTATTRDHTFDILNFGIYQIDVVDANGCSAFQTEIIASPPNDLDIDVTTATASCADGGTAIVSVSSAVGSGDYSFAIYESNTPPYSSNYVGPDTPGGDTVTFSQAANGIYLSPGVTYTFVVYDNVTNCYYFEEALLPIDSPSNLTSTLDEVANVSCTGFADGNISFTFDNYDAAASDVTYEIFNAQSNISTGAPISVPVSAPVTAQTINNAGALPQGEYYLLLTEVGGPYAGCSVAGGTFTIRESVNPLSGDVNVTKNDNCNLNAGVITANGQFGTGPYEYQILPFLTTPPVRATWAGSATNVFNVEGGSYDVYIKDAFHCIWKSPRIDVQTDPDPEISLAVVDECATEGNYEVLVTLDQAGNAPYAISVNGSAFQNIVFDASNEYTITGLSSSTVAQTVAIQDLEGCGETENFTIFPKFQASATVTGLLNCIGSGNAEITITATDGSGNFEYEINGPVNQTRTAIPASGVASPTHSTVWNLADTPGVYTVSIYDTNSSACPTVIPLRVEDRITPVFDDIAATDISCFGENDGTITVSVVDNGIGPYTFRITSLDGAAVSILPTTTSATSAIFTGLAPTTTAAGYVVTATADAATNNCPRDTTIPITISEPSIVDVPLTAIAITPFACTAGNNENNAVITVLTSGAGSVNGGSGTYTRFVFIETATTTVLQDGTDNTYTETRVINTDRDYDIIVYDDEGCSNAALPTRVTILGFDELLSVSSAYTVSCSPTPDGEITITATSTFNDTTRFEYSIDNGTSWQDPNVFSGLSIGPHTILVRHKDTGCILPVSETIEDPNTFDIDVTVTNNVVCHGSATGAVTFALTDATYTGPFTWTIYRDNNTPLDYTDDIAYDSGDENTLSSNALIASGYNIEITQTNLPSCSNRRAFTIGEPSDPISGDRTFTEITCNPTNNGTIEIIDVQGGWGGYSYFIFDTSLTPDTNDAANYDTNPRADNLSAATYEVWIMDREGCAHQLPDVTLTDPSPILADLQIIQQNCTDFEGEIEITGIPSGNPISGGQGSGYTFQLLRNGIAFGAPQTTTLFTGLGAGDYTVDITDQWGCTATTPTTITFFDPIVPSKTIVKPIDCNGPGEITITHTGGSSGTYTYTVTFPDGSTPFPPQNTGVFTGLSDVGEYTFTITDDISGCPKTIVEELVAIVYPQIAIDNVDDASCFNVADGLITVSVPDNGLSPYNFEITAVDGAATSILPTTTTALTATFDGLSSTSGVGYTVTVTGDNGCSDTIDIPIAQPTEILVPDPSPVSFECSNGNRTDFPTISVTGVTGGTNTYPRYVFVNTDTGITVQDGSSPDYTETDFAGGTYTIEVFDTDGCSGMAANTVQIVPFDEFTDLTATATPDSCGFETVTLYAESAFTNSVADPANYQFRELGGTYQPSAVFPGLEVGVHRFEAQNIATQCILEVQYIVEDPNTFSLAIDKLNDVICYNTATGAITLEISDSSYTGDFDWTIFETNGTQTDFTDDTQVDQGRAPANTVINPNGLPFGNYRVQISQVGVPNCDLNNYFAISQPDEIMPNATIEAFVSCGAGNDEGKIRVAPTGGVGPYTITIQSASQSFTQTGVSAYIFENLTEGSFDITITDAINCTPATFATAIVLEQPDDIVATIPTPILRCFNGNDASLTAMVGPRTVPANPVYEYQLNRYGDSASNTPQQSVVQNGPTFDDLSPGFYSVTVSDDIGCSEESNIIEVINPTEVAPQLVKTASMTCNNGATFLLTATGGAGTGVGPYEYFNTQNNTWTPMSGGDSEVFPNASFTGPLRAGTYQFLVRDANQCDAVMSNGITETEITPLALIDVEATLIGCFDDTATIYADAIGGLGDYEYELYTNYTGSLADLDALDPANLDATTRLPGTNTTGEFPNLVAGTYYVNVISEDCTANPIQVIVAPATFLEFTPTQTDATCSEENDGTITILDNGGGTGVYQYAISGPNDNNLQQFDTINTFTGLEGSPRGIVYRVIAQDSNGCPPSFFEITIFEPAPLQLTVEPTGESCLNRNDGSIRLNITGGTGQYRAALNVDSGHVPITDGYEFENLEPGIYEIYLLDENDCPALAITTVAPGVNLNANVTPVYECATDVLSNYVNITLEDESVLGDVLYALDSQDINDAQLTPDFRNSAPGEHYITLFSGRCVSEPHPFVIDDFEPLELILQQRNINEITAVASGGRAPYNFYFDDINNGNDNTYRINRTDTYTVRVVDENGCETSGTIFMEFIDIEIPNFFTPSDGDGLNDTWKPRNDEGFPKILTIIFDRYGREIYRMGIGDPGWEGIYQAKELPSGDYWYIIKLNGETDEREFVGHFTLYR